MKGTQAYSVLKHRGRRCSDCFTTTIRKD